MIGFKEDQCPSYPVLGIKVRYIYLQFIGNPIPFLALKVSARGRRRGKTDADNPPEAAVQLAGGQVRQPGAVLDVGAPGAARGVPQGGLEGAGLCHQDDRGAQREAQLADQHELHAEPADGEPGRHEVRGPHHEGRGCGGQARARAGNDTGAHGQQLGPRIQGE